MMLICISNPREFPGELLRFPSLLYTVSLVFLVSGLVQKQRVGFNATQFWEAGWASAGAREAWGVGLWGWSSSRQGDLGLVVMPWPCLLPLFGGKRLWAMQLATCCGDLAGRPKHRSRAPASGRGGERKWRALAPPPQRVPAASRPSLCGLSLSLSLSFIVQKLFIPPSLVSQQ